MRRFKTPNRNQLMLFPPNLNDWLSDDHPARFVVDFVESLDLSLFYSAYADDGQPPYDPGMMIAILLYANMRGICSSRKIECALSDDIGMRFITAGLRPDHDTIADFRKRHADGMKHIFAGCVKMALKAGAVGLTHVAVDGTKMRANASKNAKKTGQQIKDEIEQIERQVGAYFDEIDRNDRLEDERFGKRVNGYLLPEHLKDPDKRKAWIKEQLERQKAEESSDEDNGDDSHPNGKNPPKSSLDRRLEKLKKAKAKLEEKEQQRKEEDPTEPVFGMIKHARRLRQFLTRGLAMARAEWFLACTTHNLLKMHKLGTALT